MPYETPISLDLDLAKFEECGSPHRLLGCVAIFGAQHHLELLRVRIRHVDAEDDEVAADDPARTESYQTAFEEEHAILYEDVQHLYEGRYATFRIPGRDGDWIAYMHPYDD